MERDVMISAGASDMLLDRLYDASDPYTMHVCEECGQIAKETNYCNECKSSNIKLVKIPYACKLLFQQLGALCIKTEIIPEKY
jgi:DNA-directed RNA polymerase beta subunit